MGRYVTTIMMRNPDDWGWFGQFATDMAYIMSVSREGMKEDYSAWETSPEGVRRDLLELTSPLQDIPTNGIYFFP